MTKTPKTDAALIDNADLSEWGCGKSDYVPADFARQLEEENLALREAAILVTESFFKAVSLFERLPVTLEMEAAMIEIKNAIKTATLKLQPFLKK